MVHKTRAGTHKHYSCRIEVNACISALSRFPTGNNMHVASPTLLLSTCLSYSIPLSLTFLACTALPHRQLYEYRHFEYSSFPITRFSIGIVFLIRRFCAKKSIISPHATRWQDDGPHHVSTWNRDIGKASSSSEVPDFAESSCLYCS